MNHDKDLTLLLTLWGRPAYTRRWLRYAEKIRFPFKILLADGSPEADARLIAADVQESGHFPHLDIKYVRYPEDKDLPDYFNKLDDSFSRITTPFSSLGDNDDFPVVAGLRQCLDFMRANADYASCGGGYGGIYIASGGLYGEPRFEKYNPPFSLEASRAGDRTLAHFSRYQLTWYDVYPAALHLSLYRRLKEAAPRDLFLMELLISFLAAAEGKVKKLPALTLVRQHGAPQTSSGSARQKGDALGRMLLETWSDDISRVIAAVSQIISEKDGISLERAQSLTRDGYRQYAAGPVAKALNGVKNTAALDRIKDIIRLGLGSERFELWRGKLNSARIPLWADAQDREGLYAIRDFLAQAPAAKR